LDSRIAVLTAWSYGLAGVAFGFYGLYLLRAGLGRSAARGARMLLAAVTATSLWGLAGCGFLLSARPVYFVAYLLADPLRYGCWYAFLLLLIWPKDKDAPRPRVLAGIAAAVCGAGVLAQLASLTSLNAGGDLGRLALLQSLAQVVMALVLLEQFFRNATEGTRWSIMPLCLGLGVVFAFDFYLYAEAVLFSRIDADALSVRGLVHLAAIPLIALSTARSKGWLARIRVSQKIAFHSASLFLAGLYLLFVAGVGYYVRSYGGEWGRALQLALLFAGAMVLGMLVFSGSARATLRVLVGKHFFRYRYDYREEWLRFTRMLSERGSPEAVGQHVIRALGDLVESPAGALWLRNAQEGVYAQQARWNMPPEEATEPDGSDLCIFLAARGWVLNVDEVRASPEQYQNLALPAWLSATPSAWLLVPLLAGSELTGFVVLATPRTPTDVNWEVNDLLRTAGRQAASYLAQTLATEALLEARKFESFNRMSAFVVHDLKNIVTQLSLMLRNAERHRDNPAFQKDMLMTVEHSVQRMNQLMMQLRQGAQPAEALSGIDLAHIIESIQAAKRTQGQALEVAIASRPIVKGHRERIDRVIGHLVQNALDATARGGSVRVELRQDGAQAVVEVRDTGEGMAPEFVQERLFKPFQTTKSGGMGVGAYESAQYVKELGGRINVESEMGVGTTITMLLPVLSAASMQAAQPGAGEAAHG
jgi:putative PEP-CTERM system histidine kinase